MYVPTKGIYFASKVRHAPRWQALRDSGVPTVSTWIDEAGEGQTLDYAELSMRAIAEIGRATALLLYCEPGEILKGALIEAGAALANGTPVLCVGQCGSLSRVFRKHPLWAECDTVQAALEMVWPNLPTEPGQICAELFGVSVWDTVTLTVLPEWDNEPLAHDPFQAPRIPCPRDKQGASE